MADDDLVAVLVLFGVSAVDVAPEGSLDPSAVLVVLLRSKQCIVKLRQTCISTTRVKMTG